MSTKHGKRVDGDNSTKARQVKAGFQERKEIFPRAGIPVKIPKIPYKFEMGLPAQIQKKIRLLFGLTQVVSHHLHQLYFS